MATDPTKQKLQSIIHAAVETFTEKRSDAKYDFTVAARAMVQEAFDLGRQAAAGKIPLPEQDTDEAAPAPAAKPASKKTK